MRYSNNSEHPPRWADQLLTWFCDDALLEEIQGDLHEAFYHRAKHRSYHYARTRYILDVIRFFKPSVIQKFNVYQQHPPMLRNYFKIAVRSLIRQKRYALINGIGLTLGLGCIFLAFLYLRNETRYDQFHEKSADTYRLLRTYRSQVYTCVPFQRYWNTSADEQLRLPLGFEEINDIGSVTQFVLSNSTIARQGTYFVETEASTRYTESQILFTNRGQAFLDIFDWSFLAGDPTSALDAPYRVILSESTAQKYFGADWQQNDDVLGASLRIDTMDYQVSGVIQDVPSYSHIEFDLAVSTPSIPSWGAYTYAYLKPGADPTQVNQQLNQRYLALYPKQQEDPLEKGITLHPLADIHLQSNHLYELKKPGDVRYLYIFGIIGLIILVITCTNYTNLSVAMYTGRQKEIGMRKVMGARKRDVSGQFLFEALLLALISLPLALLILELLLPYFNQLMELQLRNDFLRELPLLGVALGLTLSIGLLSGLYPSLLLSRKTLTQLFKSKLGQSRARFSLRHALVGFQLVLLIALGSATLLINRQLTFIEQKDLGYDKEGIVSFGLDNVADYQYIRDRLLTFSQVVSVGSGSQPGELMYNQVTYTLGEGAPVLDNGTSLYMDVGLVQTLGITHPALQKLDEGADEVLLINRTAAETLGRLSGQAPEGLVGEVLVTEPEYVDEEGGNGFPAVIDGIMEDFHYFTLKEAINPMFLWVRNEPEWVYNVVVKAKTDRMYETIGHIEDVYAEVQSDVPFQLQFMDERLATLYAQERQIGRLSTALSAIAILLAVMGLSGLVSFIAYQRRAEISIRKVFGASLGQILLLVNREFALLVAIATLLAAPLAYFGITAWLDNFAYRITPSWLDLGAAGLISLVVVTVIVSVQSFQTAQRNPAQTLREE